MIYRFRVILDAKEDVFRDIEINSENTLEEFHNSIIQAFGFEGNEMASFYVSNEQWEQGEEIALFDLSEGMDSIRIMNETSLDDVTHKKQPRLIYVYDFLSMWTFLVELADVADADDCQMMFQGLQFCMFVNGWYLLTSNQNTSATINPQSQHDDINTHSDHL